MFSYQDLTEYCPAPYKKRIAYDVELKKSGETPSRPNRDLSRITIDEKSKPKMEKSDRTIRTEDVNIRQRVNPVSVPGRLTENMKSIYSDEIETQSRKLAMIGEKVITQLFKVEVPDRDDADYINRRSKYMAQTGSSEEDADKWMKANFREQFKTKVPVDITRMNFTAPKMINIVNNFIKKTKPQNVKNSAISQTALNNALMRGDLSVDSMLNIIDILRKNPTLRATLTKDTPLKPLALLSNFIVGGAVDQLDVQSSELPIDDELDDNLSDGDIVDELHDEIKKVSSETKPVINESKDEDSDVESVDEFLGDASINIPIEGPDVVFEEFEEVKDIPPPMGKPVPDPSVPPLPPPEVDLTEEAKIIQSAIRALIEKTKAKDAKKALDDANKVVERIKSPAVRAFVGIDLLNAKNLLKTKDKSKIPVIKKPQSLMDAIKNTKVVLKKAEERVLKPIVEVQKPSGGFDLSELQKAMRDRSTSVANAMRPDEDDDDDDDDNDDFGAEKKVEEGKIVLKTEEEVKMEQPVEMLLKFKTFDELKKIVSKIGVTQMKDLMRSYNRLIKLNKIDDTQKLGNTEILTVKKDFLDKVRKDFLKKFTDSDLFDIVYGEKSTRSPSEVPIPIVGQGKKKIMKKIKQIRKPSKWILEIKDIMQKEGLTYGQGMKRASEMRKK
jgi:hypothetical protein